MSVRVAIVVQRYGEEVVGGAELHARQLAEHMHEDLGWEVDVYTTTARDYRTWANRYPPGEQYLNGVRILRFDSWMRRTAAFDIYDALVGRWLLQLQRRRWVRPLVRLLEWLWIVLQGPYAPGLVRAVAEGQQAYRKICFFTYLYYPTLAGLARVADRAILIPTAHDERPFHFLSVERLLRDAPVLIANTQPEASLLCTRLAGATPVIEIAGVGIDSQALTTRTGARHEPAAVLYLGRICAGKRVDRLLEWLQAYSAGHPGIPFTVWLAGQREDDVAIPPDPSIRYFGFIDDAEKARLLGQATVVVNPSPHESLSMIVVEAIAAGVPVLVNAECPVLRSYTEHAGTVFGFTDYPSFEGTLSRVLTTDWGAPENAEALARASAWARDRFSWSRVLSVYERHVVGASGVSTSAAPADPVTRDSRHS